MSVRDALQMTDLTPAERTSVRQLLLIQYAQRVPVRSACFVWPSHAALLAVQSFLYDDLISRKAPLLPASPSYLKTFLKLLTERLQEAVDEAQSAGLPSSEDHEIDEQLLEQYTESLTSKEAIGPPPATFKTYLVPPAQPQVLEHDPTAAALLDGWTRIVMREEGSFISGGTTGLQTWEARCVN